MTKITWKYDRDFVNDSIINEVQNLLGVKLPPDYLDCIKKHNGARPCRRKFDSQNHSELLFVRLLHYDLKENNSILALYKILLPQLPPELYPFADDSFGNYLCFRYRNGAFEDVVFWDHETRQVDFVARTFTELLDMLH